MVNFELSAASSGIIEHKLNTNVEKLLNKNPLILPCLNWACYKYWKIKESDCNRVYGTLNKIKTAHPAKPLLRRTDEGPENARRQFGDSNQSLSIFQIINMWNSVSYRK